MPEKQTIRRARRAKAQGKRPMTQAGAFVKEEMEHVKRGKHGAKSRAQAIAVGLSKARRSGVKVPRKTGIAKPQNRRAVAGARSTKAPAKGARSAPARQVSARTTTRTKKPAARRTRKS